MLPLSHSLQRPRAKKRLRSVDSQSFRSIFKTAEELKSRISVESLRKSDSNVEEEVKQGTCQYKITISNNSPASAAPYKWQTGELATILYGLC